VKKYLVVFILLLTILGANQADEYLEKAKVSLSKYKYEEALDYLKEALSIQEKVLGKEHADTLILYEHIALVYLGMEKYTQALEYYEKQFTIRKKILGMNHPDTISSYKMIALVYILIGETQEDLESYNQALTIQEKVYGKEDVDMAMYYTFVGLTYAGRAEYTKAIEYYHKALPIKEKVLGLEHPDVADMYYLMGKTYQSMKKYPKALEYAKTALGVSNKNHPRRATFHHNIGNIYIAMKEYTEALEFYNKALDVFEIEDADVVISYNMISATYQLMKKHSKAFEYAKKAFDLSLPLQRSLFSSINNGLKIEYLNDNKYRILLLLTGLYQQKTKENVKNIFNLWLKYKGDVSTTEAYLMALKSKTYNSEVKLKIDELIELKRQYSRLFIKHSVDNLAPASIKRKNREVLNQLKEQKENLEKYLSSELYNFNETLKLEDIDSAQIAEKLDKDELYIDFAKTDALYYLFTLNSDNQINFYRIATPVRDINGLIQDFRQRIKNKNSTKVVANDLYEKLFKIKGIHEYKKLIISPDGELNLLPFEALVTHRLNYLIQEKEISYISSGKAFLKAHNDKKVSKKEQKIAIFARPDFNLTLPSSTTPIESQLKGTQKALKSLKAFSPILYHYLPHSRDEKIIKKAFQKSEEEVKIVSFTEENATKANLFGLGFVPTILHLSSHSAYVKGRDDNNEEESMFKSAFILAGANNMNEEDDSLTDRHFEGAVLALEFSTLNLYNSELVFFSSCQSGMGDIHSSEGVYGLNKAALIAGAKRVISTIWSVKDKESAILVEHFYTHLVGGKSYLEALQQSKLDMIKSGENSHPLYWAGFIGHGVD
jgi:CHAT domain-containing protein/Tfp pilus assembly protein PilF